MSSVTCVICGARKGVTNDWWVLFEAESGRAVWIGRAEDAQTEHPWKPTTVPFHLCGVECLYRRLNALLLPRWVGEYVAYVSADGRGCMARTDEPTGDGSAQSDTGSRPHPDVAADTHQESP